MRSYDCPAGSRKRGVSAGCSPFKHTLIAAADTPHSCSGHASQLLHSFSFSFNHAKLDRFCAGANLRGGRSRLASSEFLTVGLLVKFKLRLPDLSSAFQASTPSYSN